MQRRSWLLMVSLSRGREGGAHLVGVGTSLDLVGFGVGDTIGSRVGDAIGALVGDQMRSRQV
jgi:hypothetical protein